MGGTAPQQPMAGKMINEQFMAQFAQQRQAKNLARQQQIDEQANTLRNSGQRPYQSYVSPYAPNKDLFNFGSLYSDNLFS